MLRRSILYLVICLIGGVAASAQVMNTGQKLFIGTGATVFVSGDFKTSAGAVLNDGLLKLNGDWHNNDATGKVFDSRSTGKVVLAGGNQLITGSAVTAFPNLELLGTGVKTLEKSAEVFRTLSLNDKEFVIKSGNDLTITNSDNNSVTRTTGYVNTDQGGRLVRNTNSTGSYTFPLGSSVFSRYSPVSVEPKSAAANTFALTLFNNSPSLNGFDVNNKRPDVLSVFDKYFFLADQVSGGDNANFRFYTTAAEGDIKQLVKWTGTATWEKADPSTYTDGNFGDNLTRELLYTSTQPTRNTAFTFAVSADLSIPVGFFNAFSPNGDGSNDVWEIKNIDMFPDNEVRIFNRSGDEVYKAKGYNSLKPWDGGTFSSGTYFYVVTIHANGITKNFKGFITMLK